MTHSKIFTYLELFCYGMSVDEIAGRHGLKPDSVKLSLKLAARRVALMGFWKFRINEYRDIPCFRECLLKRMDEFGILRGVK